MTDTLSPADRSRLMAQVKSKNTGPEMTVRRLVHGMGYRYRLHQGKLPGKPDLVFKTRKKVIFVHGCFWHLHENCPQARMPKSKTDFWKPKLEGNRVRDQRNQEKLKAMGWDCLVIWECELDDPLKLLLRIRKFLG